MRLIFACGSAITAQSLPASDRVVTYTTPHQGNQWPVPSPEYLEWAGVKETNAEDLRVHCLLLCPCSERESGRKVREGAFMGGKRGSLVTCRIKEVQP